jgi:SAM-dependent methyltransferase
MNCPACGGTRIRLPRARSADGELDFGSRRTSVWHPSIAVCQTCGLGWQSPSPPPELLAKAYEDLRDDVYVDEADNRRRSFRRSTQLLERYTGRASGALLDVGCSAGLFLEVARDAGWDVWGVEPSAWLSGLARETLGDRVLTGTFEAAPFEASRFDVLTMWDVLEHVGDPAAFLRRAHTLLRPGGLVAINVPCRDSLIARILGSRWPLILPEHLTYFTRPALRAMLRASGFDVLGFHLHPVFFSLGYVLHRLGQHGLAAPLPVAALRGVNVPLLMGELTVVARAQNAAR